MFLYVTESAEMCKEEAAVCVHQYNNEEGMMIYT